MHSRQLHSAEEGETVWAHGYSSKKFNHPHERTYIILCKWLFKCPRRLLVVSQYHTNPIVPSTETTIVGWPHRRETVALCPTRCQWSGGGALHNWLIEINRTVVGFTCWPTEVSGRTKHGYEKHMMKQQKNLVIAFCTFCSSSLFLSRMKNKHGWKLGRSLNDSHHCSSVSPPQ